MTIFGTHTSPHTKKEKLKYKNIQGAGWITRNGNHCAEHISDRKRPQGKGKILHYMKVQIKMN